MSGRKRIPSESHLGAEFGGKQATKKSPVTHFISSLSMFVERKVRYSALFTNLLGWRASAVSIPLSDVFLAELDCPPE